MCQLGIRGAEVDEHLDYLLVYPYRHTHEHVLRPLDNCAIYAQQVGSLQGLRTIKTN